jgi:hypothetical protein
LGKTIRKRNGIVGFATQSAQDALESKIASAIIEQAATQIFMINPKARSEDYIDGFGLSPHEFELVRGLPDSSRCFLIKHGAESVVARLNLAGERTCSRSCRAAKKPSGCLTNSSPPPVRSVGMAARPAGAGLIMACPAILTGESFSRAVLLISTARGG